MSVANNYFISDMNFIGHENEFEQLFSIKQEENTIYYFYGDKGIGKRFFTEEFSKFYLKRINYYLFHNNFTLDYFYFNCFTELMLDEKFYEIYFNKIKKYIDQDISDEEDFINLRWVKTKLGLSDYLNEISPIFFKDFMDIEGKDGFLVIIGNPDDDIINSDFPKKLQEIHNKLSSVIPITFIITSNCEAMNKFKDKSLFKNVIYKRIKPLSDNDVRNYLEDTFEQMQCQVDEEIIDNITYLSNGHPDTMCRLGSACYTYVWKNKDYTIKNNYYWLNIRKENFYSGLFNYVTCPHIINNYFASDENIKELTKFLSILNKLFLEYKLNYNGSFYFNSKEFFNKLSDYEKSIYDDCLTYLIKNHVILCSDLEKNVYRLDNLMFLIDSKIIWEYYLETHNSDAL